MSVTTRHIEEAVGTKLEFDHNGKIVKQEAQARQVHEVIFSVCCTICTSTMRPDLSVKQ